MAKPETPVRYFKITGPKATPCNGGQGAWGRPSGKRPGKWRTVEGKLVLCQNGLHLVKADNILDWLNGPEIYEAETQGELLFGDDKLVARKARLVRKLNCGERILRLFAADCAERALKRERKAGREPDKRSWAAVKAARDYANGKISDEERAAAWAAAWAAARAAARDAARDAAWAAAWAAARDAARDAARAAGGAAEREWQTQRLLEYLDGKRG